MALVMNQTGCNTSTAFPTRCPHAGTSAAQRMVELDGVQGEKLHRYSCGTCGRGWWESNGTVIALADTLEVMKEIGRVPSPRGAAAVQARLYREEGPLPGWIARRSFAAAVARG